ncbi:MAG: hypothetical protein ACYTEW_22840, partial [Planctomycetota bacterium]
GDIRTIEYAFEPGPDAVRTPSQFEPDYGYTAMEFKKKNTNGALKIVGVYHLHGVSGLSTGDEMTL